MKRQIACILTVLLLIGGLGRPVGADDPPREYKLKAAFIYRFMQFTEWPDAAFPNKDAPFIVATLGPDPFHGSLDALQSQKINGRSIRVEHYPNVGSMGKPCHVLFISQRPEVIAFTQKPPPATLTIGDYEEFTTDRGMLRFFPDGPNIRFEINVDSVKQAGLNVRSQLLKLAKIYGQ